MIEIPDNFPSYTAYNAKQLLQQVDTLKAAIKELQVQAGYGKELTDQINALNLHVKELKELTAELDRRVEILEATKKKTTEK
jgi:cell division protein FtsB